MATDERSTSGTRPLPPLWSVAYLGRPGGQGGRRTMRWSLRERLAILAAAFVFATRSKDSCWGGGAPWCKPLPMPTCSSSSGVICGNANGSAAAVGRWLIRGGKLWGVKHATWLHAIAIRAHAPLIVFILVQAFRANPRIIWWQTIRWAGHHGGFWCTVSLLCICAFAHLCCPRPTKQPRKQWKYRRHHPMAIVPQSSFVNLCICVQAKEITALMED